MIKKRTPKTSNQRNTRHISQPEETNNTTNENDQQVITELITERQPSIIPPLAKKSDTIDFMVQYGSSDHHKKTPQDNQECKTITTFHETVAYHPREKRHTKQNTTFSTSNLKRKRTKIIPIHDEDKPNQTYIDSNNTNERAIPDDITIQAIKMKRKKIREGNIQDCNDHSAIDDFIPLEYIPERAGLGFSNLSEKHSVVIKNGEIILNKNQDSKSRLIREDDEIEDNIDEIINRDEEVFESWKESKIMFGKPNDDRNQGDQKESFGNIEMDDFEPLEDEEKINAISDFEMKQMRNAGLCIPNPATMFTQNNLFKSSEEIEKEELLKMEENRMLEESVKRFDGKDTKLIESFDIVEKQLLERMKELEISHSSCQNVITDTNSELEHSAKILSQLNEDIDQYKEQYEYFQEMGSFIDNLSDLLDTKLPEIEMIESQIMEIQERYYRQLFEKSFHGHVSFMSSYREDQYERAASFGGDGTSEITYNRFLGQVSVMVEKMKNIFNDADEEYHRLPLLKVRFESWKFKYPSLYRDTYCSLCLHKMFSIFLRYELFTSGSSINFYEKGNLDTVPSWSINPLLCTSFSVFEFWKLFFNYGENMGEEEIILPEIIRKTLLPFIKHSLSKVYNPLELDQTKSAIDLVKEYKVYLSSNTITSEDTKIMETIVERLCETVHNFKFPSIVQDISLVDQYTKQCISFISESVVPWFEIYPPLNNSDRLGYQIVNQLINTKLVAFIEYCVSNSLISTKEKIKYLALITQCKLPAHWRRDLNLSLD